MTGSRISHERFYAATRVHIRSQTTWRGITETLMHFLRFACEGQ